MTARLYSNENLPLPVVGALQERGHNVLTTRHAGKSNEGIPDDEVLRFCCRKQTSGHHAQPAGLHPPHRLSPNHKGIIVCTNNADFPALVGIRQAVAPSPHSPTLTPFPRYHRGYAQ